mmetsp:Transcript_84486/g.217590  ORF Transcript_84486/g.217590 Transcript_84486/m.217590 type:complete len:290 (-) Transcript_84486:132-1001(-)
MVLKDDEGFVPLTWGGPGDWMESREVALGRVRRRISAASTRGGKTWEELFTICDTNRDGTLNWAELKTMVREKLRLPMTTVTNNDLKLIFGELDKDNSGSVDVAELIQFIRHGRERPQDEAARFDQRMQRVRRNLRLAFREVSGSEAVVRKLFAKIDLDGSNRLTQYEFENFVRGDLGMTRWDIMNVDLIAFYNYIDRDGTGIDVNELLAYVREATKERKEMGLGAESFYAKPAVARERKRKTYKQTLEESFPRSSSLPSLKLSQPFSTQGRDRRPTMRSAIGMSSAIF